MNIKRRYAESCGLSSIQDRSMVDRRSRRSVEIEEMSFSEPLLLNTSITEPHDPSITCGNRISHTILRASLFELQFCSSRFTVTTYSRPRESQYNKKKRRIILGSYFPRGNHDTRTKGTLTPIGLLKSIVHRDSLQKGQSRSG
ncbi:hypothetical protein KM043_008347 [Ampulex compressa]|nr:hypothetical protein KM043_008347 [Ampulex compressa]